MHRPLRRGDVGDAGTRRCSVVPSRTLEGLASNAKAAGRSADLAGGAAACILYPTALNVISFAWMDSTNATTLAMRALFSASRESNA